jgi:hypothetical protein
VGAGSASVAGSVASAAGGGMVGISALLGNAFMSGSWMANSMSLPQSLRSLVYEALSY